MVDESLEKTPTLSSDEYFAIADAIGYGHANSVGGAYLMLLKFRELVEKGFPLRVKHPEEVVVRSVGEFDAWVRREFPIFADDTLHPAFVRHDCETAR